MSTDRVGPDPVSVAWDASNGDLYVLNANPADNVTVFDPSSGTNVASIPLSCVINDGDADQIAYDGANGNLFVACTSSLVVISGSTNRVVGSVGIGSLGEGVAYDGQNGDLYVSNGLSDNVTVINGASDRIVAWIGVGGFPRGIVFDAQSGMIDVANLRGGNVTVIDGSTNRVVGSVAGGARPLGMAFDPRNGLLYEVNVASQNLTVFNGTTEASVGSVDVGMFPGQAAVDLATGYLFVTDEGSGALYIVSAPVLASVSMVPGAPTISTGTSVTLLASSACMAGACPAGTTYGWSATGALGTFNASAGSVVAFTSGSRIGTATIFLNASLNGRDAEAVATISVIPGIASVPISPVSAVVGVKGSVDFAASPICTGGGCPAGTVFAWSLTNALGTLNRTTGTSVAVLAGPTGGPTTLFVNATLNGRTVEGTAGITILPTLASVSVSPSSAVLDVGGSATFSAGSACSGGTCPAGMTFSWSVGGSLGTLNSSSGPVVSFTAGPTEGNASLFLNSTLNGVTLSGPPVAITIDPVLAGVSVSPGSATLSTGGSVAFLASLRCQGGACPAGTSIDWSLSNNLGSLSTGIGTATTFTAGTLSGQETVFVNASSATTTVSATPIVIKIVSHPAPPPPSGEVYLLVAGLGVALVVAVVAIALRGRRRDGKAGDKGGKDGVAGKGVADGMKKGERKDEVLESKEAGGGGVEKATTDEAASGLGGHGTE